MGCRHGLSHRRRPLPRDRDFERSGRRQPRLCRPRAGATRGDAAAIERIVGAVVGAVDVPVTADIEAGYRWSAEELVDRLVTAGVAGFNIEDTDHRTGELDEIGRHADRLRAIRTVLDASGVSLMLNARVDVFPYHIANPTASLEEGIRRARRYAEAGADCGYPILLTDSELIRSFVDAVDPVAVNVLLAPATPPLPSHEICASAGSASQPACSGPCSASSANSQNASMLATDPPCSAGSGWCGRVLDVGVAPLTSTAGGQDHCVAGRPGLRTRAGARCRSMGSARTPTVVAGGYVRSWPPPRRRSPTWQA